MKKTYITPWKDRSEWSMVYNGIFSESESEQNEALKLVGIWKSRLKNRLPISVELTRDIIQLKTATETKNERMRVYQQSMMIIRFINLITESARKRQINLPINKIAERLGIPEWLVELRHDATHDSLPSSAALALALDIALNWLKVEYWDKEASMKCDTVLRTTPQVLQLIMEFFGQDWQKGPIDSGLFDRLESFSKSHPATVADVLIRRVLCPGPDQPSCLEPDLPSSDAKRTVPRRATVTPGATTATRSYRGSSDNDEAVEAPTNASHVWNESSVSSKRPSTGASGSGERSYTAAPVTDLLPPKVRSRVTLLVEAVLCCPGADGGITPADLLGALAAFRMLTPCPISRRESARWLHSLARDFLAPPADARSPARVSWAVVEQCLAASADPYTRPLALALRDRVRWHPAWHDQALRFCATLPDSSPAALPCGDRCYDGGTDELKTGASLDTGEIGCAQKGVSRRSASYDIPEGSAKRRRVDGAKEDKLARGISLLPGPPCVGCEGRCLLGMACECEDSLILPAFEPASDSETRSYLRCQPRLWKDSNKLKLRNIRLF